jgi:hypothetical protein
VDRIDEALNVAFGCKPGRVSLPAWENDAKIGGQLTA